MKSLDFLCVKNKGWETSVRNRIRKNRPTSFPKKGKFVGLIIAGMKYKIERVTDGRK